MFDDSCELVIPRLHHTAFHVIINGKNYSSIKSLSMKSAFIYVFWPRQQLHLGIVMHSVLHNCRVKLNQTWKTMQFIFAYVKRNDLLYVSYFKEYAKLFKVRAIPQTEHTSESFIPMKNILFKATTNNVNVKFHDITQTAVALSFIL